MPKAYRKLQKKFKPRSRWGDNGKIELIYFSPQHKFERLSIEAS